MEDYDTQLGPFFRHIRKRRGLKIRDVASGISETTLSRFERGQIDLTIAKLAPSVEALEVDPEDLFLRSAQSKRAFTNALQQVNTALVNADQAAAEEAVNAYRSATAHRDLPLRHFDLLILNSVARSITDPLAYMHEDEQREVLNFLARDDDWHRFEYMLLGHLIYFMDAHAAERCLRIMHRSYTQRKHPLDDTCEYAEALLSAMRRPLAERSLAMADEISGMLADLGDDPLAANFNYRRSLALDVLAYLKQPTSARLDAVQTTLNAMALTGNDTIANSDARWLQLIRVPVSNVGGQQDIAEQIEAES
ncbi:helix-turn-helix domain-containing protein [Lacticaseibacillus zhaodongensis]|uniref:helix-turn-helix domain-containing protein n=1 Tax=Lacticaseibacillus zhaodongensis TaxID=2668065 RepID=UPI0018AFE3ED|nr:helix-turn-helix transcriptional regulator [Lacticaseibacillus zhaodongensis]